MAMTNLFKKTIAVYLIIRFFIFLTIKSDMNLAGASLLILGAVTYSLWHKQSYLNYKSNSFSKFLGIFIITVVTLYSILASEPYPFLRSIPLLSVLGYCLIASGFRGLGQYWKELLLLLVLAIPFEDFLLQTDYLSLITAQCSTLIIKLLGLTVSRQDVFIYLPTGAVELTPGCGGPLSMVRLLRLAFVFIVMVPQSPAINIIVPIIAICIAFVTNVVRVVLLAIVVSFNYREGFQYWHEGVGSRTFSMISMLIFGLFCYFLMSKFSMQALNVAEIGNSLPKRKAQKSPKKH